jgi:hypothetical protein
MIHSVKAKQQNVLVKEAVTAIERKDELKLNELEAAHVIMASWHAVSSATISNCFRKEGSLLPVTSTLKRSLKVELEKKTQINLPLLQAWRSQAL